VANKRVRVCGPFSVESLSPHRVLSTADENLDGTVTEQEARKQQDFATMILDNLKKAGVQKTRKSERLNFDRLDPYAGVWLNAAGEYGVFCLSFVWFLLAQTISSLDSNNAVASQPCLSMALPACNLNGEIICKLH
jgi:hypothetical protein